MDADLVLQNGALYTINPEQEWAEALAVADGEIVFVGTDAEAEAFIGTGTQVVNLGGRMVLPGFHDIHAHPLEASSSAFTCFLPSGRDPESLIPSIRACSQAQDDTEWLVGFGHSIEPLLRADRPPVEIMDEAVSNRPVIIMEETSHSMWVNTAALEAARIDGDTPNPPGGIIVKDRFTGAVNGILMDNAGDIVLDLALRPTPQLDQRNYQDLLFGLRLLALNGITTVGDARTYWRRNYHEAWLQAEQAGTLTVRAVLSLWAYPHLGDQQLNRLRSLYRNDPEALVRMSHVKVYSDGLIGNTTAALLEPYNLDLGLLPENTGLNYFDEARLTQFITELETTGFDFHIHTIGDRGVHEALNAIEAAAAANGPLDRRHRLTHLELVDEVDLPRFAELGVIADMQVSGRFALPQNFGDAVRYIGDRAFGQFALRSLYDAGARVTLSSDYDVSSLSPFVGIENALSKGDESLPNLDAALRAYTIDAAYAMRQEDRAGTLEVGKWADLVVLDQNLFEIDTNAISTTQVLTTMVGGRVVHGSLAFDRR